MATRTPLKRKRSADSHNRSNTESATKNPANNDEISHTNSSLVNSETIVTDGPSYQKRRVDLPSLRAKAAAHAYAVSAGAVSLPPKRNHRPSRTAGDGSVVRRVKEANERTLVEAQKK